MHSIYPYTLVLQSPLRDGDPIRKNARALRTRFLDRTTKPEASSASTIDSTGTKLANFLNADMSPGRGGKTSEVDRNGLPYFSHIQCCNPNVEAIRVHYCPTLEIANHALKYAIGKTKFSLDCEWGVDSRVVIKRNFRRPHEPPQRLSIGLSTLTDEDILIIHLPTNTEGFNLAQVVPQVLTMILKSKDILKVGPEVKGDADVIEQWLGIKVKGVRCAYRIQRVMDGHSAGSEAGFGGLIGMTKKPLGIAASGKDENGQRSSWFPANLTERQFQYAASDATIPIKMDDLFYDSMEKAGLGVDNSVLLKVLDLEPSVPSSLSQTRRHSAKLARWDPTRTYYKVRACRSTIIEPTPAGERFAMTGMGKRTRYEYLYDFVNVIQRHLNLLVESKQESWKDDAKVRRKAESAMKNNSG
ncbi:hypothetical protein E2P81_ATG03313 [Venturia nashicola]|uniref:3'-5' exonuclease domain-containing protein n=1 Tax=Venturia nashicola TaxID=86259 RepID=A0A4Z1PEX3_9PEZI|nr:hypothetical protein E6O75_ATG03382 [Venturia nashicola]TLD36424.1 hypothetical protein E2P81_ATG03313 [Venturia nashicola]